MTELTSMPHQQEKRTINKMSSQLIYKALIASEVINKDIYEPKTGTLVPNPLFAELVDFEREYAEHYAMMGYSLVNAGDYYHLGDEDVNIDDKQSSKTKIYASIILLVRFITQEQRMLYDLITDINYGISLEEANKMAENSDYKHMLASSKLGSVDEMFKLLSKRQFVHKMVNGKFILSSAGKDIVEDIINSYAEK
jgi:hypothetical protein